MKRFDLDAVVNDAPKAAPRRLHDSERSPIFIDVPGKRGTFLLDWAEAEALHKELGQRLARGMRKRGSTTPPTDNSPSTTPSAAFAPYSNADEWQNRKAA